MYNTYITGVKNGSKEVSSGLYQWFKWEVEVVATEMQRSEYFWELFWK